MKSCSQHTRHRRRLRQGPSHHHLNKSVQIMAAEATADVQQVVRLTGLSQ